MATYDARPSGFTQLSTTSDWESFISSAGILDGIDGVSSFVPALDTVGRNAQISAGQGLIKGQLWRCDATVNTPIPAVSAQDRIDRLVLRLNRGATSSPTVVAPTIITGTPSGSPAIPALTQTANGLYDVPISYWTTQAAGGLINLNDQRIFSGRGIMSRVDLTPYSGGNDTSVHAISKVWNVPEGDPAGTIYTLKTLLGITIGATSAQTITIGAVINGVNVALATLGASFNSSTLGAVYQVPIEFVIVVDAAGTNLPQMYLNGPLGNTSANRLSANSANMVGLSATTSWTRTLTNTAGLYVQWGGAGGTGQNAVTSFSKFSRERMQ